MARKVLLETSYTFTPSTRTISIPKTILRERLLLITNVTSNQVIYNFSDPSMGATSYSATTDTNMVENTTMVLEFNTASMSATDKLMFTIDTFDETFTPAETQLDPTNKLRVSSPQALIDTDFEYGTQISKWENLGLYNNRPFAYSKPTPVANISSISLPSDSRTVTVTLSTGAAPANGTPISVVDTFLQIANGNFIIESGGGSTSFTYTAAARNRSTITQILDPNKTIVQEGALFSGARIGASATLTYSGRKITATTTIPHGLALGNEIVVIGATATTNPPNGNQEVAQVISATSFAFYHDATPTGTLAGGVQIYVRPQSTFFHRPHDGGVLFGTNAGSNYAQCVRQTRRYFRYQSGKGLQMSSGTILKPYAGIENITSNNTTTVTVQTKEKHNLQPGTTIKIGGCTQSAYNGTFVINNILTSDSFQYTALSVPSSTVATGEFYASVEGWYGCQNRLGMFDNQNGLFWEYDGSTLYAVRRNSTFQLSGKVTVANGSSTVLQTSVDFPTYFSKQIIPGDYIVIRGQSYKVQDIATDTSMTISPAYRGADATYCIVSKTQEKRIPQSEFNLDKIDGTGPSQYNIDLSKMQMFYIDYTWYGAGFIRWGVRGPKGNVVYVHKMPNNNVNTEAYMRSGNLPGRYESSTTPPYTIITTDVLTTDAALTVASTTGFPSSGTLVVRNATTYEYMNYSGKSATSFTGLTRGKAGNANLSITMPAGSSSGTVADATGLQVGQRVISDAYPEGTFISSINNLAIQTSKAALTANPTGVIVAPMGATSAQLFTYISTAPTMVELAFPSFAASISHWGTSVIMDGQFDDDKSLVFTYGQRTSTSISSGQSKALFSIRVAPSADNGIAAAFGAREIVNRMQLTLRALDVTTSTSGANLLVTAILNGTPSGTTNWTNAVGNVAGVVNSSLAQIADYAGGTTTISGGETTAGFFVGSGANSIDLTPVRDLGNSIIGGGGTTSNTNIYPDGPDVLTIVVQNIGGSTASVFGRLSWTEAQA